MHFRAEILKSEKCGHICHIFQVRCGTLGYASNRLIFLQVICLMGRQVFITIQKINQKLLFFHSTLLLTPLMTFNPDEKNIHVDRQNALCQYKLKVSTLFSSGDKK